MATGSDKVAATMKGLMDEGKYAEAAKTGEALAVEIFNEALNASYFALLTAAHIASRDFPAARLAVVRGVAESGDKSLEFLSRLLADRQNGNYAGAIGSLKSAPAEVVDLFRDILVCELAHLTVAMEVPAHIDHVCKLSGEDGTSVKGSIQRKGQHFGVQASADGSLQRVVRTADAAAAAKASGTAAQQQIASVDLVTDAALLSAQQVDRYWRN